MSKSKFYVSMLVSDINKKGFNEMNWADLNGTESTNGTEKRNWTDLKGTESINGTI